MEYKITLCDAEMGVIETYWLDAPDLKTLLENILKYDVLQDSTHILTRENTE